MRSRKLAIGLGLLFAVASPLPAFAQPAATAPVAYPQACAATSVPAAKSDEAHAFYSAGRALYDEGNYDAAITQFREAYKRDCSKHDLLVIISRSYELKGDRPEAVRALKLFLDRVKDSPDAGTHRTKIENLEKQIAAQPPPPPPPPPPQEVREHTIPPWVVVGIGGAAVVTGLVVFAVSPANPPGCDSSTTTCTRNPGDTDADYAGRQKEAGRARDQPTIGAVIAAGGLLLVGGGLAWHFLEPTGPTTTTGAVKPKLTPALAPGYAGVSVGGTF